MHSPTTATLTLASRDTLDTALADTYGLHIDERVHASATADLEAAFDADPITAGVHEVLVAIGKPTLHVDDDDPYTCEVTTNYAVYRIDHDRRICCDVRTLGGIFRIHVLNATLAIIDTRRSGADVSAWTLTSRTPDLTLRHTASAPMCHEAASRVYAPLPQCVEDYAATTLRLRVIDARVVVGAVTEGAGAIDAYPFECDAGHYQRMVDEAQAFTELREKTTTAAGGYADVWEHFALGTPATTSAFYDTTNALTWPAKLLAALPGTRDAATFTRRCFGTRATKAVTREIGACAHIGPLACAMYLVTDTCPPDWIAGIVRAFRIWNSNYAHPATPDTDPAGAMATMLAQLAPYVHQLPAHAYTRMIKPLATGAMNVDTFLLRLSDDPEVVATIDDGVEHPLTSPIAKLGVTATAQPTVRMLGEIMRIDTARTRTLADYMNTCDAIIAGVRQDMRAGTCDGATMSITDFLNWMHTPTGRAWQHRVAGAAEYIERIRGEYVYTRLINIVDGARIPNTNITLKLATSKTQYVQLGQELSNCIGSYAYEPRRRSIVGIYEDDRESAVAAVEIANRTDSNTASIVQLHARSNTTYYSNAIVRDFIGTHIAKLKQQYNAENSVHD